MLAETETALDARRDNVAAGVENAAREVEGDDDGERVIVIVKVREAEDDRLDDTVGDTVRDVEAEGDTVRDVEGDGDADSEGEVEGGIVLTAGVEVTLGDGASPRVSVNVSSTAPSVARRNSQVKEVALEMVRMLSP
jgi:hypothetical protein